MLRSLIAPVILGIILLGLLACGSSPTATQELPELKETVVFSDLSWDSAHYQNRIAMFIVQHGYGYDVDSRFGGTIDLWQSLLAGETDITMEIWLPNQKDDLEKATAEGAVKNAGKSLSDGWQSAFVVPTYIMEENPGLKSVSDLPNFQELFATAESNGKAQISSCVSGWTCDAINDAQFEAYGLVDSLHVVHPESAANLFSSLERAYDNREPWLGYLWGPTVVAEELDLTRLEEPTYSDACWAADKGCAYDVSQILIAARPELANRAPELIEFLGKWNLDAKTQLNIEGWMAINDASYIDAALYFLVNFEDVWTQWVPEDVANRVFEILETDFGT